MKIPARIQPLVEDGLVDEVIRRLKSGKEADIFVVRCGDQIRCAKVYKEAEKRGFKNAVNYQQGRKVRNSRNARAMEKRTRYGREQLEAAWQNTEVDALYRLAGAGVRVPEPYGCFEGVLLMELITDEEGQVAPRLSDVVLTPSQALDGHSAIMKNIVLMLCAGLVHGDLSEFNVLMGEEGPVIIDLPQVVDAAANHQARWMLERDVNNMTRFFAQYVPGLRGSGYGKEIWDLYAEGKLHPDVELTGRFKEHTRAADVKAVLDDIKAVRAEEAARLRARQGLDE